MESFPLPDKCPYCKNEDFLVEKLTCEQIKFRKYIQCFCFMGCSKMFKVDKKGKVYKTNQEMIGIWDEQVQESQV